jgi:hypothetical protein
MPRCVACGRGIPVAFAASATTAGQVVLADESVILFLPHGYLTVEEITTL